MKIAITILMILILQGCATSRERCLDFGFKPGSDQFANCAMNLEIARKGRISNALNGFAANQQWSRDNYGSAFRANKPALNCYTSPDFGAGTSTTCN